MSVETFLTLLLFFSTISGLATEALKKVFEKAPCNLLAMLTAIAVSILGMAAYMGISGMDITIIKLIWCIIMGLASGLCSMVGYDKVKQAITQINN